MWDVVLRGANQLRVGTGGIVLGFDIEALVTLASAIGYDAAPLLLLFHHAEDGLHQAIKQHGDSDHQKCFDPPGGDRGG